MIKWLGETFACIEEIFKDKPIVFVDVGASGAPPANWQALSGIAYYVGFDPDKRELSEDNSFDFRRFIMVNKAVADTDAKEVCFFLTASPYCSSTLKPNQKNLEHYDFNDFFRVKKKQIVSAISLRTALADIGLDYIDWLKLDSQGKDLDIYRSLDKSIQNRIHVLDIEPGITDFYEKENTFAPAHMHLVKNCFWLSDIHVQQYSRISKCTREKLASHKIEYRQLKGSPTAVEATYFRTLGHLVSIKANLRDYVCLWVFSIIEENYGFALDTAIQIIDRDLSYRVGNLLLRQTLVDIERYVKTRSRLSRSIAKALLPKALHPVVRKFFGILTNKKASF